MVDLSVRRTFHSEHSISSLFISYDTIFENGAKMVMSALNIEIDEVVESSGDADTFSTINPLQLGQEGGYEAEAAKSDVGSPTSNSYDRNESNIVPQLTITDSDAMPPPPRGLVSTISSSSTVVAAKQSDGISTSSARTVIPMRGSITAEARLLSPNPSNDAELSANITSNSSLNIRSKLCSDSVGESSLLKSTVPAQLATFARLPGTRESAVSSSASRIRKIDRTSVMVETIPPISSNGDVSLHQPLSSYSSDFKYVTTTASNASDPGFITNDFPIPVQTASMPEQISSGVVISGGFVSKKKLSQLLRRGKWTIEEEAYASKLINEFKAGLLPLTDGTTLRNYLSKLLNCDPMRISKKFVGNNCIGKQVFRRRGVDISRLTSEQMRQTALELTDLEQRFFDRVASTNRAKTPGLSSMANGLASSIIPPSCLVNIGKDTVVNDVNRPPTPPWLKPPATYKSSRFNLDKTTVQGASAALRHQISMPKSKKHRLIPQKMPNQNTPFSSISKAVVGLDSGTRHMPSLALQPVHTTSQESEIFPRSESALEQLARTASAAKFVEDIVNGDSGFGDVEIKGAKLSSLSLQGSFQALMSLDMDSVENLVHLASSSNLSSEELNKLAESCKTEYTAMKSSSSSRMESFIKSLSTANLKSGIDSNAALCSLFQNIQNSHGESICDSIRSNSSFDSGTFMDRVESSTGFSKLRAHNGLTSGRHNSVEEFLNLMASGDIPHEDPSMLNVPLKKVMDSKRSQQQLLVLASRASLARLTQSSTSLSGSLPELMTSRNSTTCSSKLKSKRKRGGNTS